MNRTRANLISLFDSFREWDRDFAVTERRGYRQKKVTYAELSSNALFWSYALAGRGIGPGDRILLWGPNSSDWIACFWAILLRGAVAVPMDAGATLEFASKTIQEAGIKLILRDNSQPELPGGPLSLIYNDLKAVCPMPEREVSDPVDPGEGASRDDIAEILFTSGTTSDPRGVVLTHGNFLANLEPLERGIASYRKYERWFHPLRIVSLVPLSHVFGQFMGLFVAPLLGATVLLENSSQPADILRTIQRERATALIAVPRMLDAVRRAVEQEIDSRGWRTWFESAWATAEGESFLRRVWRFRRLRQLFGWKFWAFISGGAALGSETEDFFRRIGFAVVQGYGMTETASLISLNHPFRAAKGSVGKILPGREFRLAPDGEILVRGENVSARYWGERTEHSTSGENSGWLHTGDLGELDAQGNLRFRGRKKSVIVTPTGLNIYPEDLEVALRQQIGVRDAVVVPLEMDGNAEPCAIFLTKDVANGEDLSTYAKARQAVEAANATLADYQRIRRWAVWPEQDFPRTPTGKPRLSVITSRAAELMAGKGIPFGSLNVTDPLASLPASLEDLSSLDRVELLGRLERQYQVELNETQFAAARTPVELQKLLQKPQARRSDDVYPRWPQTEPFRLLRLLVYYTLTWPATKFMAHPQILGRDHLNDLKGPAIFVANHTTRRADIGLILYALPMRFRHRLATAMGGETLREFRNPPHEWLFLKRWLWRLSYYLVVELFNVFPLPQFSGFRESFRFAGESVDRGYSILVFPEGMVNDRDTPDMAPFQQGIGLLAKNLGIPIVPIRLDGVWQMKREHRRFANLDELSIHFGPATTFPRNTPPDEIASRLQILVEEL